MHHNHPIFSQVRREIAERKGREAEAKVNRAFKEPSIVLPEWLFKVYAAPTNFDFDDGVDFIAKTDVGDVYLQTKSSEYFADKFRELQEHPISKRDAPRCKKRRYNRFIAVAVVPPEAEDNAWIRSIVIAALGAKREVILSLRSWYEPFSPDLVSVSEAAS